MPLFSSSCVRPFFTTHVTTLIIPLFDPYFLRYPSPYAHPRFTKRNLLLDGTVRVGCGSSHLLFILPVVFNLLNSDSIILTLRKIMRQSALTAILYARKLALILCIKQKRRGKYLKRKRLRFCRAVTLISNLNSEADSSKNKRLRFLLIGSGSRIDLG